MKTHGYLLHTLELHASALTSDVKDILEGIIELTPNDPSECKLWFIRMSTLAETLDPDWSEWSDDAYAQEWTEFVNDCRETKATFVVINGDL